MSQRAETGNGAQYNRPDEPERSRRNAHIVGVGESQKTNLPAGEYTGEGNTMKLSGYEAIEYAEEHGLLLNKYSDPVEGARKGLSTDEAREIAREDDTLIYVEHVPEGVGENYRGIDEHLRHRLR